MIDDETSLHQVPFNTALEEKKDDFVDCNIVFCSKEEIKSLFQKMSIYYADQIKMKKVEASIFGGVDSFYTIISDLPQILPKTGDKK